MIRIEWVLDVDFVARPVGDDTLQINYEQWMTLDKDQKRLVLEHEKLHRGMMIRFAAGTREEDNAGGSNVADALKGRRVDDVIAADHSSHFALVYSHVNPNDDTFLCEELDKNGRINAQFWRNVRDAERFIRVNIKGGTTVRVWDCRGDTRKLAYGKGEVDQ